MKTFTKHRCVYQENGHIQFLCVCLYTHTHTQVTQMHIHTFYLFSLSVCVFQYLNMNLITSYSEIYCCYYTVVCRL